MPSLLSVDKNGNVQYAERGREVRAWHTSGLPLGDRNLTAEEAGQEINGFYGVEIAPLYYFTPSGDKIESGRYQMYRSDTLEPLGSPVKENYRHLDPLTGARLADKYVRNLDGSAPGVETIGVLKNGEIFFITWQLPPIIVKDETLEQYLYFGNTFTGRDAIQAFNVAHRVVCGNTQALALARFRAGAEGYGGKEISHHGDLETQVGAWLEHLWTRALETQAVEQEVYNILADRKVVDETEIKWIIGSAHPAYERPTADDYPEPEHGGGNDEFERAYSDFEKRQRARQYWVDTEFALMTGQMKGADSDAANGTLYGALQGLVEAENYGGKLRLKNGTHAMSVIGGNRATKMQRAAEAAMALVDNTVTREEIERVAATVTPSYA